MAGRLRVCVFGSMLVLAQSFIGWAPRSTGLRPAKSSSIPDLSNVVDENEVKLAELIFSTADPRIEVASAPQFYDDDFISFVSVKAEDSEDVEERVALKSLVEMIKQVRAAVEKAAEEVQVEDAEATLLHEEPQVLRESSTDIFSAATEAVGVASASRSTPEHLQRREAGLSGDALATYDRLLTRLLEADKQGRLTTEVEANYETCDYSLLSLADERRHSDHTKAAALGRVVEAVNALAAKRLESAAMRLQSVLRAGAPEKMMAKITELAATGGLDTPLVELLEANRQQAEQAGPAGAQAAELMRRLAAKCRQEMDRRFGEQEPEKKLLRALLRCGDDLDAREKLIRRAFEPKEAIELGFDGRKTEGGPDVEPPKFINACLKLVADFGNVDLHDGRALEEVVKDIANQAEVIAIEIYGECGSPREMQDRMWAEQTTSVFDLEAAELAAESKGERLPWQNDQYDDM